MLAWFRHANDKNSRALPRAPSSNWSLAAARGDMELWQRQGFDSFGAWRRATEVARRAARKAATLAAPTVSAVDAAPSQTPRRPTASQSLLWEPVQPLSPPSAPNSPVQLRASAGLLPGGLHEHVQVTPNGRRVHMIKHTSPGGTARVHKYVSPAGAPQLTTEERLGWRRDVSASRRAANAIKSAVLQAACPAATQVLKRCGTCSACFRRGRKRKNADGKWVSHCVPCESWTAIESL